MNEDISLEETLDNTPNKKRLLWDMIATGLSITGFVLGLFAVGNPLVWALILSVTFLLGSSIALGQKLTSEHKDKSYFLSIPLKIAKVLSNIYKTIKYSAKLQNANSLLAALGVSAVLSVLTGPIFLMSYSLINGALWLYSSYQEYKQNKSGVAKLHMASAVINLASTAIAGLALLGALGVVAVATPYVVPILLITSFVGLLATKMIKFFKSTRATTTLVDKKDHQASPAPSEPEHDHSNSPTPSPNPENTLNPKEKVLARARIRNPNNRPKIMKTEPDTEPTQPSLLMLHAQKINSQRNRTEYRQMLSDFKDSHFNISPEEQIMESRGRLALL